MNRRDFIKSCSVAAIALRFTFQSTTPVIGRDATSNNKSLSGVSHVDCLLSNRHPFPELARKTEDDFFLSGMLKYAEQQKLKVTKVNRKDCGKQMVCDHSEPKHHRIVWVTFFEVEYV